MFNFKSLLSAIVVAASIAPAAKAATYDVVTDLTPTYVSDHGARWWNLATYSTDFIGMLVTVDYADGGSESLTWQRNVDGNDFFANIFPPAPNAESDDFSMSFVNRGFSLVSNVRRLSSVTLDLAPASAIFDVTSDREFAPGNTFTTHSGSPFRVTDDSDLAADDHVTASYSGLMQLAGFAPGVDAFTQLVIDFSQAAGGGLLGAFAFAGDTDALAVTGDLTAVPLPKGILLMLAGLGAFGAVRLRSRSEKAAAIA